MQGQIARFVAALITGDANILDKIIGQKLGIIGEQYLLKQLSGQAGAGIGKAISSGLLGQDAFTVLRNQWLNKSKVNIPNKAFLEKLFNTMEQSGQDRSRRGGRKRARWTKTEWAKSRNDWLDNSWKHDWRSQPRNIHGQWIPGRLDYVPLSQRSRGRKAGRRTLRRRRLRRLARLKGRRAAKKMFRSK